MVLLLKQGGGRGAEFELRLIPAFLADPLSALASHCYHLVGGKGNKTYSCLSFPTHPWFGDERCGCTFAAGLLYVWKAEDAQAAHAHSAEWNESSAFNGHTNGFRGKKPLLLAAPCSHLDTSYRVRVWHPGLEKQQLCRLSLTRELKASLRGRTGIPEIQTTLTARGKDLFPSGAEGLANLNELLVFLGKNPVASR